MNKRLTALAIFLLLFPLQASPFKAWVIYNGPRLADETIEFLSKLAREPDGAKKVGNFSVRNCCLMKGKKKPCCA